MTDLTVADTILQQLGGRKFTAMTGATNLLGSDNSLSCRLPGTMTKDRVNVLRITLDPSDTYTVETIRVRGVKVTPMDKRSGIYVDTLVSTVSEMTGLTLRLF